MKYVAIIGKTGNGYAAHLPDLPGCIAAADTFEETRQLIEEAANFHVEGMIEDGETIPEPLNTAVEVEVEMPTPEALQQATAKNRR
jgi:predicted RNase H-like HicB family nuclease